MHKSGARSPGGLNFVRWHLIFVGPRYCCWILVAFLALKILKWLLHFWKICTPLAMKLFQLTSKPRVRARGMQAAIVCLINFDLVVALCLNRVDYLRKQVWLYCYSLCEVNEAYDFHKIHLFYLTFCWPCIMQWFLAIVQLDAQIIFNVFIYL